VQVEAGGIISSIQTVTVAGAALGLFTVSGTGTGPGAITHANYSLVTDSSPAIPGETILIYATGLGATDPPVADGQPGDGASTVLTPYRG